LENFRRAVEPADCAKPGGVSVFDRIYKICRISEDRPPQAAQKLTMPPNNLPLSILPLPIIVPQTPCFRLFLPLARNVL
jgi:hypothetical protein